MRRKATPLPPPVVDIEDVVRFELAGEVAEVIYIAKKKTAWTPIGNVTHEDLLRYGFEPQGDPLPYPVYLACSSRVDEGETVHIINISPPDLL